jgi:hypothetical protein
MKRIVWTAIGSLAAALTGTAQIPHKQIKAAPRPMTYSASRGPSAVRQLPSQGSFSSPPFRQPSFSAARARESGFRTARIHPRTNTSFPSRESMRSAAAPGTMRPVVSDYSAASKFSPRPRQTNAFVNRRSGIDHLLGRREQPHPSSAFRSRSVMDGMAARTQAPPSDRSWADSRLVGQAHTSRSLLEPFTMNDAAAWRSTRTEFNNRWATSYFKGQTRHSFVNRRGATTAAIQEQRRAAFNNNWRGDWFAGGQYRAFRNYQPQWHDSSWWRSHCDRIVFVTVYSDPFPFYFDAGYWYPAWGYYAGAYYPYDGPIYGYNDLPPDEIIANVQVQLYNDGYYDGPIDGILGPDTRGAIADYQADYGLAVTATVDEPTVESLGLV